MQADRMGQFSSRTARKSRTLPPSRSTLNTFGSGADTLIDTKDDSQRYLFFSFPYFSEERFEQEHYILQTFLGSNYLAPICRPAIALDIGCGTAIWIMVMTTDLTDQ